MLEASLADKKDETSGSQCFNAISVIIGRKAPVNDYVYLHRLPKPRLELRYMAALRQFSRIEHFMLCEFSPVPVLPQRLFSNQACGQLFLPSPLFQSLKSFVFMTSGRYSKCLNSQVGNIHGRLRLYETIETNLESLNVCHVSLLGLRSAMATPIKILLYEYK
jgi:hypothetical protein